MMPMPLEDMNDGDLPVAEYLRRLKVEEDRVQAEWLRSHAEPTNEELALWEQPPKPRLAPDPLFGRYPNMNPLGRDSRRGPPPWGVEFIPTSWWTWDAPRSCAPVERVEGNAHVSEPSPPGRGTSIAGGCGRARGAGTSS